jgi:hypothetical protein
MSTSAERNQQVKPYAGSRHSTGNSSGIAYEAESLCDAPSAPEHGDKNPLKEDRPLVLDQEAATGKLAAARSVR